MGDWSVTIIRQSVEQYPRDPDRGAVLADWTVGATGLGWLKRLVERDEARQVRTGGYPSLYSVPAGVIALLLAGDEPPFVETVGLSRPRGVSIKRAELEACAADELLTIAVWDQS